MSRHAATINEMNRATAGLRATLGHSTPNMGHAKWVMEMTSITASYAGAVKNMKHVIRNKHARKFVDRNLLALNSASRHEKIEAFAPKRLHLGELDMLKRLTEAWLKVSRLLLVFLSGRDGGSEAKVAHSVVAAMQASRSFAHKVRSSKSKRRPLASNASMEQHMLYNFYFAVSYMLPLMARRAAGDGSAVRELAKVVAANPNMRSDMLDFGGNSGMLTFAALAASSKVGKFTKVIEKMQRANGIQGGYHDVGQLFGSSSDWSQVLMGEGSKALADVWTTTQEMMGNAWNATKNVDVGATAEKVWEGAKNIDVKETAEGAFSKATEGFKSAQGFTADKQAAFIKWAESTGHVSAFTAEMITNLGWLVVFWAAKSVIFWAMRKAGAGRWVDWVETGVQWIRDMGLMYQLAAMVLETSWATSVTGGIMQVSGALVGAVTSAPLVILGLVVSLFLLIAFAVIMTLMYIRRRSRTPKAKAAVRKIHSIPPEKWAAHWLSTAERL